MAHFLTRNIFVDYKYNSAFFCTLYIQALCISCTKYERNPPPIVRVLSISKYLVQIHNINGFSSRATYFSLYTWHGLPSVLLQNGVFFWFSFSANTQLCLHDFSFLIFDTQGQTFIVFNYKQCDKSSLCLRTLAQFLRPLQHFFFKMLSNHIFAWFENQCDKLLIKTYY